MPTIDHCQISQANGDGIGVHDTSAPTILHNTISHVEWPVHLRCWTAVPANIEGNVFGDGTYHGIRMDPQESPQGKAMTWKAYPDRFAYVLAGWATVQPGDTLNVEAGAIVKLESGNGLFVNGILNARGTPEDPIVFTALTEDIGGDVDGDQTAQQPGWWDKIRFGEGSSSTLEYCQIRYARTAAVDVVGDAALALSHCEISQIDGIAVWISGVATPTISHCQITHADIGIEVREAAAPVLSPGNAFSALGGFGVSNLTPIAVDARNCWWGDASGPSHATLNPEGKGVSVSDNVEFSPYLTRAPQDETATLIAVAAGSELPGRFALQQNYPNPFNPSTTISYQLPSEQEVVLSTWNLAGQLVRELVHAPQPPGHHSVNWDSRDAAGSLVANGVYLYEIRSGDVQSARKMVLMK